MTDITNLKKALLTLKQSYKDYSNCSGAEFYFDYIQDSCVQRFEYTLETILKLAKRMLKEKHLKKEEELSVNNIFRYMESYGYTKNWENWKHYYKERNNTSHEYNIEKSRELIKIIPDFIEDVEYFINKFDEVKND